MTIRKNSKLVKEILSNDSLKVESDSIVSMATLRREFNQFNNMVTVQEYSKGKAMFHFHSNLVYIVTL